LCGKSLRKDGRRGLPARGLARRHHVTVTSGDPVEAVLAAIVAGDVSPYDGAFDALRLVLGVRGVRELERLPSLRNLRVVTDDLVFAQALTRLDLSRFPELQRLRLGCPRALGSAPKNVVTSAGDGPPAVVGQWDIRAIPIERILLRRRAIWCSTAQPPRGPHLWVREAPVARPYASDRLEAMRDARL
jgi:hypothetical protein